MLSACLAGKRADFLTAQAACANISDAAKQTACLEKAAVNRNDAGSECGEQHDARQNLCGLVGEAPYEPDVNPAHFDADFAQLTNPNPWFPIAAGYRWKYLGESETIVVNVTDKVKAIRGITCIVFHDRGIEDGLVTEDTFDWVGQRKDGSVVYCGEISSQNEEFDGDDPQEPELVSIEGSWKTGRDGAKPGTLFPAVPQVGDAYRQELLFGEAEDAAKVLSVSYRYGEDAQLDELVPQALATALCAEGDCVVTREFSPLEPHGFERKYYARGIGLFLTTSPRDGSNERLVGGNMDPRCDSLP
jgi:hypothetical protein